MGEEVDVIRASVPPGRSAAVVTVGSGDSPSQYAVMSVLVILGFTTYAQLRAGMPLFGLFGGVATSALLIALDANARLSVGSDWVAERSVGGTRWVDLPTLTNATVRRTNTGLQRLALRDASDRHMRVNVAMVQNPKVVAALRAAIPDHHAPGFDDTFRQLLAGPPKGRRKPSPRAP